MSSFIRLTLIPTTPSLPFLQMDILSTNLVLSQGQFQPVQTAPTVTVTGVPVEYSITPFDSLQQAQQVTNQQVQELKVVFREPVDAQTFPDTSAIEQPDPTGGAGVFGITLNETRITFAPVTVSKEG
jgi:hypothetical protein